MRQFPDESIAAKYLINTHMMVKVVEFHPDTQTVDVVQEVYDYVNTTEGDFVVQNEFGVDVTANVKVLDVLYDIPVKQERFGQFSIKCCPKKGDTGYLEIFTEDLQDWFKNGGPSVPWAALRFLRKNSVFVPFVPNKTNCAQNYPQDNSSFVIESNRTKTTIEDPEDGEASITIQTPGATVFIDGAGKVRIETPETVISGKTVLEDGRVDADSGLQISTPYASISGSLQVGNGASGLIYTGAQVITVTGGIVTNIS